MVAVAPVTGAGRARPQIDVDEQLAVYHHARLAPVVGEKLGELAQGRQCPEAPALVSN